MPKAQEDAMVLTAAFLVPLHSRLSISGLFSALACTLSFQQAHFQIQLEIVSPVFTLQIPVPVLLRRAFFKTCIEEQKIGKRLSECTLIAKHFSVSGHKQHPADSRIGSIVQFCRTHGLAPVQAGRGSQCAGADHRLRHRYRRRRVPASAGTRHSGYEAHQRTHLVQGCAGLPEVGVTHGEARTEKRLH